MSYAPLATESPNAAAYPPQQRMSMRIFRRPVGMAAFIGILFLGIVWDFHRPSSTTHDLIQSSGWLSTESSQYAGSVSEHTEPISVVLMAGKNDHQVLESARSLLSTTVGPYELIGVFTEPSDQSQRIVDILVNHHRAARVDSLGRGMTKYTSLNVSKHDDFALHKALDKARYGYVGIVNANTKLIEYGWDRILLTGLKSSDSLLAVSGKAAVNIRSSASQVDFTDAIGQILPVNHDVVASPPSVQVRNAAIRSPILYDVEQVLAAGGWMGKDSEHAGLGDVEICLRAAEHEKQCGFYPISTTRLESARGVWQPAPGELVFPQGEEGEETLTGIPLAQLGLGGRSEVERLLRHAEPVVAEVEALPRRMEDVPRTIVTAFSGNHQNTVQQWYNSLHLAPHTRFVAYILPSDVDVDPASYSSWHSPNTEVEIRTFDFSRRPAWVDVTVNRGEYAWKPLIVEEIVRDYGGLVFWMDAGDIIEEDFGRTWNEVAERGLLGIAVGGPVNLWLHPAELAYLDFPPSLMENVNCNGAMWGINAQHYDSMMKISRPLFDCARTRACIAPLGSSRENHRQDQAALSALIHLHGYKCDYHPPIRMGGDAPGDGSKFCEDGREC